MTNLKMHGPFEKVTATQVVSLSERFETPLFVYDDAYFRSRCKDLMDIWTNSFERSKMYLSYKTNYTPALCRAAHEQGFGADFVSGFELEHAKRMCPKGPYSFNGPLKRKEELSQALAMGATINIDMLEELKIIKSLVHERPNLSPRLGIRINPGIPLFDSQDESYVRKHCKSVAASKFGWPVSDGSARRAVEKIHAAGFSVVALHSHLNSQITNHEKFLAALLPVLDFAAELIEQGMRIEEINVGGGFGVGGMVRDKIGWWGQLKEQMGEPLPLEKPENFDMSAFVKALKAALIERGLNELTISSEPGRYLFSDAMALLTKVVGVKRLETRTWLVLDGGLNIMPTAAFGEKRRLRFFSQNDEYSSKELAEPCAIGGPLCFDGDVIMSSATMPNKIIAGDLVLISDAGAYTVSRSTNFNQLRAAAVSINGSNAELIWRRENYDDVFSFAEQR